jgi:hypothetical protein
VEFKRATGETFTADTQLPAETNILTPSENSSFDKVTPIHTSWTVARDNGPRGITLSVFLGDQINTCGTEGNVSWDTEGTATIPANYVASCRLPLKARFGVFYVNPNRVAGVAGGTFKGYSTARVNFIYSDKGSSYQLDKSPFTAEDLRMLTEAKKSGHRSMQILRS